MACPFEEKLTSWLLGDLSEKEQDEVTCHVFTCASCKQEVDELRRVLFPLRSALHKDQGLFKQRQPLPCRRFFHIPRWLCNAAVLLISFGLIFLLMSLYYHGLNQRQHRVDGPVTNITFGKMEKPMEPLEPVVVQQPKEKDILADLNIVRDLGLDKIAEVLPPELPGAQWTPSFVTINQLAFWGGFEKRSDSVHDRLMRELPDAKWDSKAGPLRKPRKERPGSVPPYGPTVYASPRYEDK